MIENLVRCGGLVASYFQWDTNLSSKRSDHVKKSRAYLDIERFRHLTSLNWDFLGSGVECNGEIAAIEPRCGDPGF